MSMIWPLHIKCRLQVFPSLNLTAKQRTSLKRQLHWPPQVIVILDPHSSSKPRLHMARLAVGNTVPPKEKRYVFDKAYDGNTDNRTLYSGTVKVPQWDHTE